MVLVDVEDLRTLEAVVATSFVVLMLFFLTGTIHTPFASDFSDALRCSAMRCSGQQLRFECGKSNHSHYRKYFTQSQHQKTFTIEVLERGDTVTKNKRFCIMVDDSLEAQIIELRKSDQFCRMSIKEAQERKSA